MHGGADQLPFSHRASAHGVVIIVTVSPSCTHHRHHICNCYIAVSIPLSIIVSLLLLSSFLLHCIFYRRRRCQLSSSEYSHLLNTAGYRSSIAVLRSPFFHFCHFYRLYYNPLKLTVYMCFEFFFLKTSKFILQVDFNRSISHSFIFFTHFSLKIKIFENGINF